jgi:hypothetical protein
MQIYDIYGKKKIKSPAVVSVPRGGGRDAQAMS